MYKFPVFEIVLMMEPNQPTQIPSTTPTQPLQSTYPPPSPSKLPIIILVIITLTSVGGLVYFYFQTQSLKNNLASLQTTPSATPFQKEIVTTQSDLRSFSNSTFQFMYSSIFTELKLRPKEFGSKIETDIYEATYLDPNQKGGGPGYTAMLRVIGPSSNPKQLSIEKWIEDQGLNSEGYGGSFTRTNNQVIIDSEPAIIQTGINKGFPEPTEFNLYISKGNNIYTISYSIQTNEEGSKEYIGKFDEITSTFKFEK